MNVSYRSKVARLSNLNYLELYGVIGALVDVKGVRGRDFGKHMGVLRVATDINYTNP